MDSTKRRQIATAAPEFALKIPNTQAGRVLLAGVRAHANRERYDFRVVFGGPRLRGEASTRKVRATAFRVYFKDAGDDWRAKHINDLLVDNTALRLERGALREERRNATEMAERYYRAIGDLAKERDALGAQLSDVPLWARRFFKWFRKLITGGL